ncbi:MAG: 3-isopropylmalate dehydratase small subunit [Ramlibacter sp.]|nr:3-isopropylmalate dehydratase small subunit [Ramlibacter sp.]
MKKVLRIAGVAAPLPLANVDTDVIIRIEKLGRCPRDQLGDWGFAPLRFLADGSENPQFVLNQPGWRGAKILVAGANFGCGSSREHAVWALQGMGIECVIAPSFGDIFRSNCFQNGLLPVQLPNDQAQALLDWLEQEHRGGRPQSIEVDLEQLSIRWPGGADLAFALEQRRRHALMEGLDAIGETLAQAAQIDAWQARDRQQRPWIWQLPRT